MLFQHAPGFAVSAACFYLVQLSEVYKALALLHKAIKALGFRFHGIMVQGFMWHNDISSQYSWPSRLHPQLKACNKASAIDTTIYPLVGLDLDDMRYALSCV
jgi:hypothetical protein